MLRLLALLGILGCHERGKPTRAAVEHDRDGRVVIAAVEQLSRDDGDVDRTTRYDARSGEVLGSTTADADFYVNVSRCATVATRPPLVLTPYFYGRVAAPAEAELGVVTIPPVVRPLGFVDVPGDQVLLLHGRAFGASRDPDQPESWLSNVDTLGHPIWTVQLAGACEVATVVDGSLVMAIEDARHRVVAIDLVTGATRWSR